LKFIRKKASLPPLGLLTVAAMLPEAWEKRLVDMNAAKLRDDDLAWADLVFISGMIAQQISAHERIARCRAAGRTIVAGGPLFTLGHEQFPTVDHFVLNEAEVTLPEFFRDFEHHAARRVHASKELPDIGQTPATPLGTGEPETLHLDVLSVLSRPLPLTASFATSPPCFRWPSPCPSSAITF
jgi:radical SAM superfamily enzyme YgiQ (UPF0313 family)